MQSDTIASNLCLIIPGADFFHFGVLSSRMHMAWVRVVAGRLESRYRYSNKLVYNNFPWPPALTRDGRRSVAQAAQQIVDARSRYNDVTFADLYDPRTMPEPLLKAHTNLDRVVDRCYRRDSFPNDQSRVEYLFSLYEQLSIPLFALKPKRRKKKAD
jgi:hypothetical protein